MAKTMITQNDPVCKRVCNFRYSYCDSDPDDYHISGAFSEELVGQILSGTNGQAMTVLGAVGHIGFVPGIGDACIPLNEFAWFYGVTEEYLRSVLRRRRWIARLMPDDIRRASRLEVMAQKPPVCESCPLRYKNKDEYYTYAVDGVLNSKSTVSLPIRSRFCLYSPRLVLACALALMYKDSGFAEGVGNTRNTLLAIKRSPYRFIHKREAEQVKNQDSYKPSEGVPVTAGGDLQLSPELFTHMIKTAVKEAVSEVLNEVRLSAPVTRPPPRTLRRPRPRIILSNSR